MASQRRQNKPEDKAGAAMSGADEEAAGAEKSNERTLKKSSTHTYM
jgi:hypothetical protein